MSLEERTLLVVVLTAGFEVRESCARTVLGRTRVFLHGRVAVGRLLRDRGINPRFNLGRTRRG